MLSGDFTPLRDSKVEFTSLLLPGGAEIPLNTIASSGLKTLVPTGKQKAKGPVTAGVSQVKSIPGVVRNTDKKEWLSDFAMSKLPYHPQYVRSRTRFDAELASPLNFGSATLPSSSLTLLGSQPAVDSMVHARLVTPLYSKVAIQGQKVEAVLEAPLFASNHDLVLPEGTRLNGEIVLARGARWLHRSGRLRFRFEEIALSPEIAQLTPSPVRAGAQPSETARQFRTQGILTAAESGQSPLKVDKEGEVQVKDSKKRFIGTAISALLAASAADNDAVRSPSGAVTGTSSNVAGRTLGGGMGFGLIGTAVAQSSRSVGTAFGYYGLAFSVFSTVLARGSEVQFDRNSVVDIEINARPASEKIKSEREIASSAK